MADADSEALIDEIINPTPGFVVDDALNVDTQLDFQSSDLDTSFILSNTLQERLNDILEKTRIKVSSLKFPGEATVDIPNDTINDSLYPHSQIKTEDIYIDNSLRDVFSTTINWWQKRFLIKSKRYDITAFKLPTLNFVSIAKKDLKDWLDKIIEDLDLNLKETLMSEDDQHKTKQKISTLKKFNKRFSLTKKSRYWKATSITWVAYKIIWRSVKTR